MRLVGSRDIDARAERIFVWKEPAHEFFADDGDERLIFAIHFGDAAAGDDWNLHHAEVIAHDRQSLYGRFVADGDGRVSVDREPMIEIISGERKVGHHRGLLAGELVYACEQFAAERGLLRD